LVASPPDWKAIARGGGLIDPASPVVTVASPFLHHPPDTIHEFLQPSSLPAPGATPCTFGNPSGSVDLWTAAKLLVALNMILSAGDAFLCAAFFTKD